jgi:hypothetical protein
MFRRKLHKAGVATHASMTHTELQALAGSELRGNAEEIGHISELYGNIRYAPKDPDIPALKAAVQGFRPARRNA